MTDSPAKRPDGPPRSGRAPTETRQGPPRVCGPRRLTGSRHDRLASATRRGVILSLLAIALASGRAAADVPGTGLGPEPPVATTGVIAPAKPRLVTSLARAAGRQMDSAACGTCHAKEYELWRGSHHDRAMMAVSEPGAVLGDFNDAVFERDGLRARFFRRDGGWWVEITERGSPPETFAIAWTFGVFPLQQVLVKIDGGRVQALTIAWDARPRSAGGQRWYSLHAGGPEPPPGDPMHWRGPAFRWNSMCADCHSTGLVRGFDPVRNVYRTRFDEIDVGCRACHAPHESNATGGSGRVSPTNAPAPTEESLATADGVPASPTNVPPPADEGRVTAGNRRDGKAQISTGSPSATAPPAPGAAATAHARQSVPRHANAARAGSEAVTAIPGATPDAGGRDGHGAAVRRWVMDEGRGIARLDVPPAPGSRSELETCAPCHSRRANFGVADPATAPFLDAHRPALLEAGLYEADGQDLDEVYVWGSFVQSRMHAAGVVCSDCHEPHSLRLRADGNALCARCHLPARFDVATHHLHPPGSPGARCVNCHMPEHTFMGVDARRDHGLRVPRPDLTVTLGVPEPCTGCHAGRDAAWAARVLAERHGPPGERRPLFPAVLAAVRDGSADAPALLLALARDPEESAIARATALSLLPAEAGAQATRTVEAAARDSDPLLRLGAARALENLPPPERLRLGTALLADPLRAIRLEAATALVDAPRAQLDATALQHALDELHEAHRHNADDPGAHLNEGLLAQRTGDLTAAERHYRDAIQLAPWFVPAWVNQADLQRLRGDDGAAEETLRRAARAIPDAADVHSALGLTLVRLGRRDEAVGALERAAALAPDEPRHAWLLAVALDSIGRPADSRRVVADALAKHPRHDGLRALLGQ